MIREVRYKESDLKNHRLTIPLKKRQVFEGVFINHSLWFRGILNDYIIENQTSKEVTLCFPYVPEYAIIAVKLKTKCICGAEQ